MIIIKTKVIVLFILLIGITLTFAQENKEAKILLDTRQAKYKINKEIYGHFAEHLGNCIYGGFFVGENSSIPNTRGIRNDVIKALKEMQIPVLRWPGGCFADTYHWKNGIGPQKDRPKMLNVYWGRVSEDNSFGTHEFMDLCDLIGAEPYISANVGSGTVQEMQEWVQYLTSNDEVPIVQLRKKNGRENPWKIKYWGIGNESWGCGGNMRPEYYSDLYKVFNSYCFNYDKNILYRVASGGSDADYNWTEVVMKNIPSSQMQGLSLHYYTMPSWNEKGSATQFNENQWYNQIDVALKIEDRINKNSAIMDQYDADKLVGLIVDEWGSWYEVEKGTNPGFLYQQNTLRDALIAGLSLNIFNNHCDRVKMANIAQIINVLQSMILTKNDKIVLTPSYYVFKMYKVHQNAMMIPLTIFNTPRYTKENMNMPLLNGSASIDSLGTINITLCNLDAENEQALQVELNQKDLKNISGEIITGDKINSNNDFGKPEEVTLKEFSGFTRKNNAIELKLPPKSVVLIKIKSEIKNN